jgi:hypothetical protein
MASTYRVVLAELPLNERVTKQTQDGDALLHGWNYSEFGGEEKRKMIH